MITIVDNVFTTYFTSITQKDVEREPNLDHNLYQVGPGCWAFRISHMVFVKDSAGANSTFSRSVDVSAWSMPFMMILLSLR